MNVMTAPDVWSDQGRALTVEDMESMPDDEFRYELDDGILIVSPAPSSLHQRASLTGSSNRTGTSRNSPRSSYGTAGTSRWRGWPGMSRSAPTCPFRSP
jgi:hypothetical protein